MDEGSGLGDAKPLARLKESATLVFVGDLPDPGFAEFAAHRAGRLALGLLVRCRHHSRFECEVTGDPDLIDAFEMACSLGPLDCLVHDCWRLGPGETDQ